MKTWACILQVALLLAGARVLEISSSTACGQEAPVDGLDHRVVLGHVAVEIGERKRDRDS